VRLDHFEDEKIIVVDEAIVLEPAFEARVTLGDPRRPD
jgi:hypothetical protein